MQVLIARNRTRRSTQGLVVVGGGERNGMAGIVVGIGIVGIEGMLGSGGKVTLGTAGIVGMLGSGGKVGFGREGRAVGKVGCGGVDTEGNGGNVGLGKFGSCRRWRPASPHQNDKRTSAKLKHLKPAILLIFQGLTRL